MQMHSMDRGALSGAGVQCGQCGSIAAKLSRLDACENWRVAAGVGRRHPVTRRR